MGISLLERDWHYSDEQLQQKYTSEVTQAKIRRYFWEQMTDPNERFLVTLLKDDVRKSNLADIDTWLNKPTKNQLKILEYGNKLFSGFEKIFLAHLTAAYEVIDKKIHDNPIEFANDMPRGFMSELASEFMGEPKRTRSSSITTPFVVLSVESTQEAELAQFRFELLPSGCGEIYITPEQAFLIDTSFSGSLELANKAAYQLIGISSPQDYVYDVRVRLEEFLPWLNEHECPLLNRQFVGASAGGAAARGLYFLHTHKLPDEGIVVLAKVAEPDNHMEGLGSSVKWKIRRIVDCNWIKKVVVVDEEDYLQAVGALKDDWTLQEVDTGAIAILKKDGDETRTVHIRKLR